MDEIILTPASFTNLNSLLLSVFITLSFEGLLILSYKRLNDLPSINVSLSKKTLVASPILALSLSNSLFVFLANSNSSIFKHIECEIKFGNNKSKFLSLDIADTFEKRSYGLMNREKIETNEGMLFIWEDSKIREFWMKNTYFNLDLFFVNKYGVIVEVFKNAKAFDEKKIISKEKVKFVLEMKAGDIKAKVGDNLICSLN